MRAEVVHPDELGEPERARWRAIQDAEPLARSPFLSATYAAIVGAARADTRVAVVDGGAAFFGFHRGPGGLGAPLGRTLADYQALVAPAAMPWSLRDLVRACGLTSYAFDHALLAQPSWRAATTATAASPVVDLARFAPDRDLPGEAARKARRLAREGEPRYLWHDASPATFARLVAWKRAQYAATGVYDIFDRPWVPAFVEQLARADEPDLRGVLASLHDGEDLIAAHLFLRSGPVLHSWIPAHDPQRGKLSPGLVLLRSVLTDGPAHGVALVDFGKGDDAWKLRVANDAISVGAGVAHRGASARIVLAGGRAVRRLAERTRLQGRAYRAQRRLQLR